MLLSSLFRWEIRYFLEVLQCSKLIY